MTREQAINVIKNDMKLDPFILTSYSFALHKKQLYKAQEIAIRNLEMWDKVIDEIQWEIDFRDDDDGDLWGLSMALNIINKHLKEVEE